MKLCCRLRSVYSVMETKIVCLVIHLIKISSPKLHCAPLKISNMAAKWNLLHKLFTQRTHSTDLSGALIFYFSFTMKLIFTSTKEIISFTCVHLFVGWLVFQQDYTKSTVQIPMELRWRMCPDQKRPRKPLVRIQIKGQTQECFLSFSNIVRKFLRE